MRRARLSRTVLPRPVAALLTAALTAALTVAFAGVAVTVPAGPAAAATVDTDTWYVLVNRHSGKALDVYERATEDGAPIVQWERNDGAWQQWRFVDSGDGHYRVQSRHSGKVLDIRDQSTANGADLVQWTDSGDRASQEFRLADSPEDHVRLVNRHSHKALDVFEWSTEDGARVAQWDDHGGANQQWRLVPVDEEGGTEPPPPPGAYPDPDRVTGDTGVHDPEVVQRPDGTYLMAHTGHNVALKTSTDRVHWTNAGAAFPDGAPWTTQYTDGDPNLWAPDISYHNGQYYLYYSASTFGQNRSAIFLATSPTGASGSWTHQGLVVESDTADDYNAIDPSLLVDDQGRWWLAFGSFWSGIKSIPLDPSTGLRSGSTMHSIAGRGGGAIEAPTLVSRNGYYYLYASFGQCCQGADSTYRVMAGRGSSPTGPFYDRDGVAMTDGGGTEILASHGGVHGPGHQTVLADDGGDVLFYHYYTDTDASVLGINRLQYDESGWPYVS